MPTGWEQWAGSEIGKGIPCVLVDTVHKEGCRKFLFLFKIGLVCAGGGCDLYHVALLEDLTQNHALAEGSYICWKMFLFWGLDFFCPFVWTTTDCSLSLLVSYCHVEVSCLTVLLLSVWWWLTDSEWYSTTFWGWVSLSIFQELWSCVVGYASLIPSDPCSVFHHLSDHSVTAGGS